MEQYIVIAKETAKGKYEDYRIVKVESPTVMPEGFIQVFGPASLDDCQKYFKEVIGTPANWFGLTVAQYALIFIVTIAFVAVISWGAYNLYKSTGDAPLKITDADDAARVLITFLVAVATVAIAFLAILTAMVLREYKERFALAKEVLTILIGILGTIVGFYFGAAKNTGDANSGTLPTPTATPSSTPNNSANTNSSTNSNTITKALRLPSGGERYLSYIDYKDGRQKIILTVIRKS